MHLVVERRCVFWRRFQERVWYKLLILYPDIYSKAKAIAFCILVASSFLFVDDTASAQVLMDARNIIARIAGGMASAHTADASLTAADVRQN